jgi:hypothetical protein
MKSISSQRCASNIQLLLYQGIQTSPDLFASVCDPMTFETQSYFGVLSTAAADQENQALIPRTPASLPVLLAWSDHDGIFPADPSLSTPTGGYYCGPSGCQGAENALWQSARPGHVTIWSEHNCGHHFPACATMPSFASEVVSWLAANGLGACHPGDVDGDMQGVRPGSTAHAHLDADSCADNEQDGATFQDPSSGIDFSSTQLTSIIVNESKRSVTLVGIGIDAGHPVTFTIVGIEGTAATPSWLSITLGDGYTDAGYLSNGSVLLQ